MFELIAGPFYALGFVATFAASSTCPLAVFLDQYDYGRTIVRCEELTPSPVQPRRYQALTYEVNLHGFYLPPGDWICSAAAVESESVLSVGVFEHCGEGGPGEEITAD